MPLPSLLRTVGRTAVLLVLLPTATLAQKPSASDPAEGARAESLVARAAPASDSARAVAVVERRLAAYNAHDLEAFLATLAEDVTVSQFPSQVVAGGRETLRESYGRLFATRPELRAVVEQRIVQGPFVIDHEFVDGLPGGPRRHTAIYLVGPDERIERIWYITDGGR